MESEERGLTIEELADRVEVSVRTVRFYIAQGLVPGPGARGKGASYGEEHLLRLWLIRRLSEQHVPLAEQRERLSRLSLDEVRALLAEQEWQSAELLRTQTAPSPKEYIAALLSRARAARWSPTLGTAPGPQAPGAGAAQTWRRWELAPGVELHVRCVWK